MLLPHIERESCLTWLCCECFQVLHLKQKPHEGRVYDKDKEDLQEYVSVSALKASSVAKTRPSLMFCPACTTLSSNQ